MATLVSLGEYEYRRLWMWHEKPAECRMPAPTWERTLIACPNCTTPLEGKAAKGPMCWPPRAFLRCKGCGFERDTVA